MRRGRDETGRDAQGLGYGRVRSIWVRMKRRCRTLCVGKGVGQFSQYVWCFCVSSFDCKPLNLLPSPGGLRSIRMCLVGLNVNDSFVM